MRDKELLRQELLRDGFDCYTYFLVTGSETAICEKLNRKYDDAYFLVLKKMMHKSKDGVRYDVQDIMLNKHIFMYVKPDTSTDFMNDLNGLVYLNECGDNGKLTGNDKEYARWVLEIDGLIGLSTAVLEEGPTTVITSGPLLKFKDSIRKYERRNRNCLVSMDIAGNRIETWLPFVWENDKPNITASNK